MVLARSACLGGEICRRHVCGLHHMNRIGACGGSTWRVDSRNRLRPPRPSAGVAEDHRANRCSRTTERPSAELASTQ